MITFTTKNYATQLTTTLTADNYQTIGYELARTKPLLNNEGMSDLITIASNASKILNSDELTMFTPYYDYGDMFVSKLDNDTYLLIIEKCLDVWEINYWNSENNSHEIGMFLECL